MAEITRLSPSGFAAYLDRTGNTICGRRVVEFLFFANEAMNEEGNGVRWVRYEKSSEVKGAGDESASYAGGVLYRHIRGGYRTKEKRNEERRARTQDAAERARGRKRCEQSAVNDE